jgi:hypothetical protein
MSKSTQFQQLIPSQTPEQFSKLPCSTAVPLFLNKFEHDKLLHCIYIYNYSIFELQEFKTVCLNHEKLKTVNQKIT